MDPVAAGLAPGVDHRVADPLGTGEEDAIGVHDTDTHRVHENVAAVALVELSLPSDGGDPDTVAVVPDARHDPPQQEAVLRVFEGSEANRVERSNRPRAHREDVAQNAPNPGRRTLLGLDEARMVVALDLEDRCQTIPQGDRAGVLAGTLQDVGRLGGQRLQVELARFVGAVFRPHDREDSQLREARVAAENLLDVSILGFGEAVFESQCEIDDGIGHRPTTASTREPRTARPSVPPMLSSTACSGCGIKPRTLPASFVMPAIPEREPLGLNAGET